MINSSFQHKVPIKNGLIIKRNAISGNSCGSISTLAIACKSLYTLMGYITTNNMEYLLNNFNLDVYTSIGQELFKIKVDPIKCPEFERIRIVFKVALEMLYMYVNMYKRVATCDQIQTELNEKNDILNNIELLKERIKALSKQVNLFEDSTIQMPAVEIKFEYIIYIQKYGYPETGVFDTDLLEEIKQNMNL
jgi:hypothetical protein